MKHTRTILLGTSILGLLVFLGAGCGTQSSDSSDSVNSDVALANTNDMANNGELIGDDTNAANAEASSVDTSDWNTYTNEEYGFSFQYPNGTKLDETNNYDYAPNLSFIKDIENSNKFLVKLSGVDLTGSGKEYRATISSLVFFYD